MSRGKFIALVILALIILFAVLFGAYWYSGGLTNKNDNPSIVTSIKTLFGFGPSSNNSTNKNTFQTNSTNDINASTTLAGDQQIPILRQITGEPVAGVGFTERLVISTSTVATSTATTTLKNAPKPKVTKVNSYFIRYVERATGNIYETSTSTLINTRITNTTIPKVYEAYLADLAGNSYIYRTLIDGTDVIKSEYETVKQTSSTSTENSLIPSPLPYKITSLDVNSTRDQIFYILDTNPRGVVSKTNGASQKTILDTPLKEWLANWVNSKMVVITTKPSGNVPGYLYSIDPTTKDFNKLLGDINGLTALVSPNGKNILYSESAGSTIDLNILKTDINQTQRLFLQTLPEKCVWSKDSNILYCAGSNNAPEALYPDSWYQGNVSFSDSFWKLNIKTGQSTLLANPQTLVGTSIDATNISLDSKEDALTFINKNDLTPWVLLMASSTKTFVASSTASTN